MVELRLMKAPHRTIAVQYSWNIEIGEYATGALPAAPCFQRFRSHFIQQGIHDGQNRQPRTAFRPIVDQHIDCPALSGRLPEGRRKTPVVIDMRDSMFA